MPHSAEGKPAGITDSQSEGLLEQILATPHAQIVHLDRDFTILRVNRAFAAADGRPPEALIGRYYFQLYPDPENERIFCMVAQNGIAHQALNRPFSHPDHPDRGVTWWDWSLQPILDASDRVEGLVLLQVEVTARARCQQELEKAEGKFRALFDGIADMVLILSPQGAIRQVNPAASRRLGVSEARLSGLRLEDLMVAGNTAAALDRLREVLLDGQASWELALRDENGAPVAVEAKASLIEFGGRSAVLVVGRERGQGTRPAAAALGRANRALKGLKRSIQAVSAETDEAGWLQRVCDAIVRVGGYRMAWIGRPEADGDKCIRPVAFAGHAAGYTEAIQVNWGSDVAGDGPGGRAVRTGKPQFVRDILGDPQFSPWRRQALERGFASTCTLPLKDRAGRVAATLNLYSAEPDAFSEGEADLLYELAAEISLAMNIMHAGQQMVARIGRREQALQGVIGALARAVELHDPAIRGHHRRVERLCKAIGRRLGLEDERVQGVGLAGAVHDVGKIVVSSEILGRAGALAAHEYELIKSHPQVGHDLLKDADLPWPVAEIVLQHHEKLDGSGYPHGLMRGSILPEARILAVADVVEAMSRPRPYRRPPGLEAAIREIQAHAGSLFDPDVVAACTAVLRQPDHPLTETA